MGKDVNQQQIAGWLRNTLSASGPLGVLIMHKLGLSVGDYQMWLDVFMAFAPGAIASAWTWYRNREDQQIRVTESLSTVAKVVVKDSANGKVGKLAVSNDHPNIVTESQNAKEVKAG